MCTRYPVIRFIVGESRAGVGYGMYGIFGNIVSFFVPVIAGCDDVLPSPSGFTSSMPSHVVSQ